ncbi:MAG: phosphatase PAP2 family protein [Acidimicrobiia bacterium]|nr:phosphatase PAP2 family protein [Acidimicrobiia bacterium]
MSIGTPAARPRVDPKRLLVLGLVLGFLLIPLLPRISLDTWFADAVVRLTDTASWTLMTPISIVVIVTLVARRGLPAQRRVREAAAMALVMVVALAGNGQLNEQVVKPAIAIERPNIVTLAETGVLGSDFPDAETLYAVGDKEARRGVLRERLTEESTPQLSSLVRAHWVHETGYSFPSGHTTAAVTFAALLAAIGSSWLSGWRRVATLYVIPVWALAIAASRTLLEVHTAWDVIAGAIAGLVWGWLAYVVAARIAGVHNAAA